MNHRAVASSEPLVDLLFDFLVLAFFAWTAMAMRNSGTEHLSL